MTIFRPVRFPYRLVDVGEDVRVPLLVEPALDEGTLRALQQPCLAVDDQLTLRPWRSEDVRPVMAAFDQPDIQRWHVRRIDSELEARDWIAGWSQRWARERDASWAIVRHDDQAIGQVGLRTIMLFAAQAQMSYWVLPDARGAGVAARATLALSRWAFDTLGLHRLFLKHSAENPASCRVALNAGFRPEGMLRGEMLHADGWHDTHVHGRLRTDVS
jgi:RimJ/RimL family protein N-acetyltransferase